MFSQSYSRAMSADLAEIERRLRALEKRLERAGGRTAAGAMQAADRMGDAIASALSDMSDRFRDGSRSVGGGALKLGNEAAKEAAKLGNDALQRLADLPGGQKALTAVNDLRNRVDELAKKVRGIDEIEARVTKLEKEVAALKKAKAPARRQAPRKPAA